MVKFEIELGFFLESLALCSNIHNFFFFTLKPEDVNIILIKQTLVVHAAEDSAWYLSILLTNVNHKIMIKNLSIACN